MKKCNDSTTEILIMAKNDLKKCCTDPKKSELNSLSFPSDKKIMIMAVKNPEILCEKVIFSNQKCVKKPMKHQSTGLRTFWNVRKTKRPKNRPSKSWDFWKNVFRSTYIEKPWPMSSGKISRAGAISCLLSFNLETFQIFCASFPVTKKIKSSLPCLCLYAFRVEQFKKRSFHSNYQNLLESNKELMILYR